MLEKLTDIPAGIDGLKAVGKVSKEDYDQVAAPELEEARREGRRIRLLYEFGPDFEGFTPGGAWEDAKLGLRSLQQLEGLAVVSDIAWIREGTRLLAFVMPCPVKVFSNEHRSKAVDWLGALPDEATITCKLVPEKNVIVVDVRQALRVQDFDTLALAADSWIETRGNVPGLVIHARHFPGWENLGSLISHVRFVRDHHKKIKRVALTADTKLAGLTPSVAEHFVEAEVKSFAFDQIDDAIAWAGGNGGAKASGEATAEGEPGSTTAPS